MREKSEKKKIGKNKKRKEIEIRRKNDERKEKIKQNRTE